MGVTVQRQIVAGGGLNNPRMAREYRALPEQPTRKGKCCGIQGSLHEHVVFLQQVPRILPQAFAGYLGGTVVADCYAIAFFASA